MDIVSHIKRKQLITSGEKVLVAVSGGPDSVVLLDVLIKSGYDCVVAHCNFHLRGDDSDEDQRFVASLAKEYGCEYCTVDFDTTAYAGENNLSIEMAARTLRYDWFEVKAGEYGCDRIAVAHNANDTVETFFLNLVRGTGINGLIGIAPRRGRVVRPLLDVKRTDIMKYVDDNGLAYRTDATNADTIYRRNKIRHDILPQFEQLNPSFIATMLDNMNHLAQAAEIVDDAISHFSSEYLTERDGVASFDLGVIKNMPGGRLAAFEWLRRFGFTPRQIEQILDNDNIRSGRRFASPTSVAVVNRSSVEIWALPSDTLYNDEVTISVVTPEITVPIQGTTGMSSVHEGVDAFEIMTPIHLSFQILDSNQLSLERDSSVVYFDADTLGRSPLVLRHWRRGDKMTPFGMRGKKKISDLLTEAKLSIFQKSDAWVLTYAGGTILWLVGIRASDDFKIGDNTKKILKISFFRDK